MTLTPAIVTRLEKVAFDNGFDLAGSAEGDWLAFTSTQSPLRIWLTQPSDDVFVAALSQWKVGRALDPLGEEITATLPAGAHAARAVVDIPALHHLVRRAFQLSRTLPDELLHTFEKATAALPRTTETERLVIERVGQDLFRRGLIEYWEGRCAITGLSCTELLRASHIKPWADCETDAERLDVFNGLLLTPHLDAVFDAGFITIADDGSVIISAKLADPERTILGLNGALRVEKLTDAHRSYLVWHRDRVFRTGGSAAPSL